MYQSSLFAQPMSFRWARSGGNGPLSEWIVADGAIAEDTGDRFEEFVGPDGFDFTVVMDGIGGNILSAVQMGDLIRERNGRTVIGLSSRSADKMAPEGLEEIWPGQCASACAYAFLGGIRRTLEGEKSRFAVHKFTMSPEGRDFDSGVSVSQSLYSFLLDYIVRMGVSPNLLVSAGMVAEDEFLAPDEQKLLAWNVLTRSGLSGWKASVAGRFVGVVADEQDQASPIKHVGLFDEKNSIILLVYTQAFRAGSQIFHEGDCINLVIDGEEFEIGRNAISENSGPSGLHKITARLPRSLESKLILGRHFELTLGVANVYGFHRTTWENDSEARDLLEDVFRG